MIPAWPAARSTDRHSRFSVCKLLSPKVSERKSELNIVRETILSYLELRAQIEQLSGLPGVPGDRAIAILANEILRFSSGH
jgi:hypothetical protein